MDSQLNKCINGNGQKFDDASKRESEIENLAELLMQVSFKAIRPILALEPNNLTAMDTSELAGSEDYMNAYYAMAEKIIDKRG